MPFPCLTLPVVFHHYWTKHKFPSIACQFLYNLVPNYLSSFIVSFPFYHSPQIYVPTTHWTTKSFSDASNCFNLSVFACCFSPEYYHSFFSHSLFTWPIPNSSFKIQAKYLLHCKTFPEPQAGLTVTFFVPTFCILFHSHRPSSILAISPAKPMILSGDRECVGASAILPIRGHLAITGSIFYYNSNGVVVVLLASIG